jgi:Iap family predicted aminopeptidase
LEIFLKSYKIQRNLSKYKGFFKNTREFSKIQGNFLKYKGIYQNTREFIKIQGKWLFFGHICAFYGKLI